MLPLPLLKKKKIKQEMILLHILQYYKSNLIINTIKKKVKLEQIYLSALLTNTSI